MNEFDEKLFARAYTAHQSGRLDQAEILYLEFLQNNDDFNAQQLLGLIYSKKQKTDLAISYMRQSLASEPGQPAVHNNLAICLKRHGMIEEAIDHYRQAIALKADYLDAYRNLAQALQQSGDYLASAEPVSLGLAISPRDAGLLNLAGNLSKASNDYGQAIAYYQESLEARPDHPGTVHNLGVAYRLNNQPARALKIYQRLLNRNISGFELHQNIGNAYSDLGDLGPAIECYRQVLNENPLYVHAHRNLSKLLWSTGQQEEFVTSYSEVAERGLMNDELARACAETLLAAEQAEAALTKLDQYATDKQDPKFLDLIARCHLATGHHSEALHFHELASAENPALEHRLTHAITLLQAGHITQSTSLLEQIFKTDPTNQYALSHLTLCWRLQGDERESVVNNYADLIRTYEIPIPNGFATIEAFNAELGEFLTGIHTSKNYPFEQTLRHGTQSQGNLFALDHPLLVALVASLTECVDEHLRFMAGRPPPYPDFPRVDRFDFSASWSVRLMRQGFHTMHVHPMGWFSSAYYVAVPDSLDAAQHEGWLKFGEPNFKPIEPLPAEFFVEPQPGRLALFPSYMWHGTVPFESLSPRTTVVFDTTPVYRP